MKLRIETSRYAMIVLAAMLVIAMNTAVFAASGTWASTGSLQTPRDGHTAALFSNGNVVVASGEDNNGTPASTEVYNPIRHRWCVR